MSPSSRVISALVLGLGLALGAAGCTYYQVAPGVYSTYPAPTYDRAWSAALGALEDQGVQIVNADRGSGTIRGLRGGINVTALVRSQADASVQIEFKTSGNTDADPTLIDRITRSYNARMGR